MAGKFLPLLATFVMGALLASIEPVHQYIASHLLIEAANEWVQALMLHHALPPKINRCHDFYATYPLSPAIPITDMEPNPHPIPKLTHITLAGKAHYGNRNVEMWLETLAPGGATPIHTHDCEEVFWVYSGTGTMRMKAKDGSVVAQKLAHNATITVLPNTRHQFANEGDEDVQFVVAFDKPPMVPTAYQSWDTPVKDGRLLFPLPWDAVCPPPPPKVPGFSSSKHEQVEL